MIDAGDGDGSRDGQQRQVVLASPKNLIRIDGICRYASELNRGQGLGFTIGPRRIDNTFATSVLLRVAVSLCVMFPVMCKLLSSDAYLAVLPWDDFSVATPIELLITLALCLALVGIVRGCIGRRQPTN